MQDVKVKRAPTAYSRAFGVLLAAGLLSAAVAVYAADEPAERTDKSAESRLERAGEKTREAARETGEYVKEKAHEAGTKIRKANRRKVKTTVTVPGAPQKK